MLDNAQDAVLIDLNKVKRLSCLGAPSGEAVYIHSIDLGSQISTRWQAEAERARAARVRANSRLIGCLVYLASCGNGFFAPCNGRGSIVDLRNLGGS
jgi:hypothetical protein